MLNYQDLNEVQMNVKENRVFVILDVNALHKNMETSPPPKMTEDLDFYIILYHALIYSYAILCVYCVLFICACMCVCAHVCLWRHITCAWMSEDSMWVLDTELKLSGIVASDFTC